VHAAKVGRPYCRSAWRAAECEEAARNASDDEARTNLEQMGKAWARVAKAYEFVASLERFLIDAHKSGRPIRIEELPDFPEGPLP
jgi:hypothetical protein